MIENLGGANLKASGGRQCWIRVTRVLNPSLLHNLQEGNHGVAFDFPFDDKLKWELLERKCM